MNIRAFEILDFLLEGVFSGGQRISPVLPEYYSGSGGEWAAWVDDVGLERSDGLRQNFLIKSRGVAVFYCNTIDEAKTILNSLLEAFSVNRILSCPFELVSVTLERMQVVVIRNSVAVVATVTIEEEK